MQKLLNILNHRDFVLILALIVGLVLGERTKLISDFSIWILALIMVFALTSFSFRSWLPVKNTIKPVLLSILLNYIVFGIFVIALGWILFKNGIYNDFYIGLVLIAAAPPGPSIIPFSALMKGDNNFSVTGVFGLYFAAMIITPVMLLLLLGESLVSPVSILKILLTLIVFPLLISRFLRHKKILPIVEKSRNTIMKWGFFLVIMIIVGMSSSVIFSQPKSVLLISVVFFVAMYVVGAIYHLLMRKAGKKLDFVISSTFILAIKSSAFSAVTALTFFPDRPDVALPSAILSVFVTLFIIFYSRFVAVFEK
ncbi:MAG: bile acid:sodium symporter family protein, partial [Bacteroidota bacterium]